MLANMGICMFHASLDAVSNKQRSNTRLETLALFAQSIYLVFTSIYIFKETLEHILLSSHSTVEVEAGAGHHHHHGDDLEM
jgi:hypothetical protein